MEEVCIQILNRFKSLPPLRICTFKKLYKILLFLYWKEIDKKPFDVYCHYLCEKLLSKVKKNVNYAVKYRSFFKRIDANYLKKIDAE